MRYLSRVVDAELDDLLGGLPAISLEGPKGVGKTATAHRRANEVFSLDDPVQRELLAADPGRLDRASGTVLVDEWQRYPPVWDAVRRSVDRDPRGGRFLLTGSATPAVDAAIHSGAGRIVRIRMRPMSLHERNVARPTVSLAALLSGEKPDITGESKIDLPAYTEHILASGFPGMSTLEPRHRRIQLDSYLDLLVQHDFPEQGHLVRRPATLRAWLAAYAAATATTASYNEILNAATPGEHDKPAKSTVIGYRDVLTQLWVLDALPGWTTSRNSLGRLAQGPKHHLVDPALAARLLRVDARALLAGVEPEVPRPRDGTLLGQLFESLVTLNVRVYAQAGEAAVHHLRTRNGDHEVDLIVEREDRRVVALEVKLGRIPEERDLIHLRWLQKRIGDDLLDAAVITTGEYAYRRPDGIAVIPAALLGP